MGRARTWVPLASPLLAWRGKALRGDGGPPADRGSSGLDRGQDVVRQDFLGLLVHALSAVVRAGDYGCQIQLRNHDDLIAAIAGHEERRIALAARLKRLQPPEITVFGLFIDTGVGPG